MICSIMTNTIQTGFGAKGFEKGLDWLCVLCVCIYMENNIVKILDIIINANSWAFSWTFYIILINSF